MIMRFFHRMASPVHFYRIAGKWIPWLGGITLLLILYGLYGGLIQAPTDYQQGESYRIIYIHVPSAWMSMFIYVVMAVAGLISLVWRMKLAEVVAISSAPIGASFTFLALATGSLWGKPMWGTWWVWDARLTSELILLFLYIGYMALRGAIDDTTKADKASAVLALVGAVNVPIIHFSVEWWSSLHQGPTLIKEGGPAMDPGMLYPLLAMIFGYTLLFGALLLRRVRAEVLFRERRTKWVKELVLAGGN